MHLGTESKFSIEGERKIRRGVFSHRGRISGHVHTISDIF